MTNREVRIGMTVYHKFRPGEAGSVLYSVQTDGYSRSGRMETRYKVKWSRGQIVAERAIDLRKTPSGVLA